MRGLTEAALLLASATAVAARPVEDGREFVPSAFVTLNIPSHGNVPAQDLTLRLDVLESASICGPTDVKINGQTLAQPKDAFSHETGALAVDDSSVVASWNIACIQTLDGKPIEQVLNLVIESIDNDPINDVTFQMHFQQVAPVFIGNIEGAASSTTLHVAAPGLLDGDGHKSAADKEEWELVDHPDPEVLDGAFAHADMLRSQIAEMQAHLDELRDHLHATESFISHQLGWPGHGPMHSGVELRACKTLDCVFGALMGKVKWAAGSLLDSFHGPEHWRHHRHGRHGHHDGPWKGPGCGDGPGSNHSHGNHSWPHPPPPHHKPPHHWRPPFCPCAPSWDEPPRHPHHPPPPPPPPHHEPPHSPPHGPPRDDDGLPPPHGPPHHPPPGPPNHGPPHHPPPPPHHGPPPNHGHPEPPPKDDDRPHDRPGHHGPPPPPPPPPHHGPPGDHFPPPPPPPPHHFDGPPFPPEARPPWAPHPAPSDEEFNANVEEYSPPPPPPPHHHPPPPPPSFNHFRPGPQSILLTVFLLVATVGLISRCYCSRLSPEDRDALLDARRRRRTEVLIENMLNPRQPSTLRWVFSCCGLLSPSYELDDEEKRQLVAEMHASRQRQQQAVDSYDSESDSDMSTTMEEDIARLRQAALVIGNMISGEAESRNRGVTMMPPMQQRMTMSHEHVTPPSPTGTLPLYVRYDDTPPEYMSQEDMDEAASSIVSDGFRGSPFTEMARPVGADSNVDQLGYSEDRK